MVWAILAIILVSMMVSGFIVYFILNVSVPCSGYGFMCPQCNESDEIMEYPTQRDIKQVIVMRRKFPDGKGIRRGKEIAQACHASMCFLSIKVQNNVPLTLAEEQWLQGSFKKVCLQVDTEDELLEIETKAKQAGLSCYVITDSGLTEFGGVPTKTCLAIGPDFSEKVDLVTQELKLY